MIFFLFEDVISGTTELILKVMVIVNYCFRPCSNIRHIFCPQHATGPGVMQNQKSFKNTIFCYLRA